MKFFMMIGIPGSGKSTKALELAKIYNAEVFSSDEIGLELHGQYGPNGKEVFDEMNKRIEEALKNEKNIIFDATNTKAFSRIKNLELANTYKCEKIAVWIKTDYKKCFERNKQRDRKVPEVVISRFMKDFEEPILEEGFDKILIIEN